MEFLQALSVTLLISSKQVLELYVFFLYSFFMYF
jgi:hypothetical protein